MELLVQLFQEANLTAPRNFRRVIVSARVDSTKLDIVMDIAKQMMPP